MFSVTGSLLVKPRVSDKAMPAVENRRFTHINNRLAAVKCSYLINGRRRLSSSAAGKR